MPETAPKQSERFKDKFSKFGFRSKFHSSSTAHEQPSRPEPLVPPLNVTGSAVPNPDLTTRIHSQSHATTTDLWTVALESRPDEERAAILTTTASGPDLDILERLSDELKHKRDQCEQKSLKVEFHGQQIVIRDVLEKALAWINKFKEIGDIVVQYDPVHAALPWAGVRFLLQTVTAGSEQMAALLVGVEKISSMISRCRIYESMYLEKHSSDQSIKNLQSALVAAYALIQDFLLIAHRLYSKRSTGRAFHAMLNPAEITKFVDDFKDQERQIEYEARICESVYTREATGETAKKIDDLRMLLLSYKQPSSRLDSRVAAMFTQIEKARQSEMLRWISPIPYQDSHESAREKRTKGTGHWLLENSRFSTWQNSSSSTTLWLHGSPGTGKTKLVSHVVDDLILRLSSNPNDEALAYFYCDRNRTDYQTPTSILSSFVRQLSLSRDEQSVQQSTVLLYDKKKTTGFASNQLNLGECQDQLRELTEIYPQTTLVLDALDECDKSTRIGLVIFLNELVKRSSRLLKIFIASRPDLDLRVEFVSGLNVEIRADDNEKDIDKYVEDTITNTDSPPYWRRGISKKLRESVCETLVSRSEGMFQWVALQIHQLHKLSRERDIKMRLGKLPKTLEEAYHEIYERIQSTEGSASDVAKRAFQWIMCSEEPMSPAMLVAAVCQDPTTDDIDDVDINFDFVLESCQNLLKVEGDEEYAICRFSHLSVQEYLEKDRLSPLSNDVFVAQVCLTILTGPIQSTLSLERAEEDSVESNESEELEEDGMKEVSEYASAYWLIHVQRSGEVEGDFDNRLITLLKRFLGSGAETTPAYEKWYRTRRVGRGRVSSMHSREYLHIHRVKPPSRLALQIAMFGLHRMLQDSWEHVEPGQENAWVDPLLVIAAHGGCVSTVQSLLDKRAEIDASSAKNPSALYEASIRGHESVVKLLLEKGANVNISCGYYGNVLQAASVCGDASIVGLLVASGANVNAQGGEYHNALQAASHQGHEDVVRILLKHGAFDPDGKALSEAASEGHEAVVAMLLQASTIGLNDALVAACKGGTFSIRNPQDKFQGVVTLLLDAGAVDLHGEALIEAAREGNTSVVARLLKEHNVGVDEALVSACGWGTGTWSDIKTHEDAKAIVILLLNAGAVDREGHALQEATRRGFAEVVTLLLDAGAVDLHGEALIEAARESNTSVVARLLKEHNVGVDEALVSACGWGTGTWSDIKTHEDAKAIVILLLNAGAVDREGHALQEAMENGFAEAATLLRETAEKSKGRISEVVENLSDERIPLKGVLAGSEPQRVAL